MTESQLDVSNASRRKHPWRLVAVGVIAILAAQLLQLFITNERFAWGTVGKYLFSDVIFKGLLMTLGLTVVAMLLGTALGVILAICRISKNPVLSGFAAGYIWFFRGTPLLVQLIFFYNLSALVPQLSFGIPFAPPMWATETNSVVTPMLVAILGLGLHEAAYMAEIVRGGLLSVDPGQREAGYSVGMTNYRVMRRVILPQAMRFIIPPTGNQVISMLKATSLVSVIAMADLFYTAQSIYNRTFETIPLLIVSVIWYLVMTTLLNIGQSFIERHYSRSSKRDEPGFFQFLTGGFKRPAKPAAVPAGSVKAPAKDNGEVL
ncbi:amino acid ABC transporter permease [Pseudarthrobacter sulfonivorans]|uniref:amino acid ABC transporter permease n=1 Tax=Pseudarthrobacter sulfonivorans TaxID=121292 RepID=UPI002105E181|nr:amino acid ABC transporter permease [Pseudarthrobacter sulfonivorans]